MTTQTIRLIDPLELGNEPVRNLLNTARRALAAAAAADAPRARHSEALAAAQAAGKALVLVRGLPAETDTWAVLAGQPDNQLAGWAQTFAKHATGQNLDGWVEGFVADDALSNADAFQHLVEHLLGQPFRKCAVCARGDQRNT